MKTRLLLFGSMESSATFRGMGIEIYFSHHLETLAAKLGGDLLAASRARDPFIEQTVIVPNANVKRWLQIAISEQNEIVANVGFPALQHGLWEVLDELAPEPVGVRYERMNLEVLRLLVMSAIIGHAGGRGEAQEELLPLQSMLFDAQGKPRRGFAGRLWQVSGRLSRYLREYELYRPDMVVAWCHGDLGNEFSKSEADVQLMERCQMALYRMIFRPGGLRDQLSETSGSCYLTLPQYAQLALKNRQATESGKVIHVFGLSQVSNFHRDLLFRLSNVIDVKIYQMNVCSEFWEDITTDGEDRWLRIKDASVETNEAGEQEMAWDELENMLLKWWGKPGRENVKLLGDLETQLVNDMNLETFWLTPDHDVEPDTVLAETQHQILNRSQRPEAYRFTQDRSVQIFGAPDIFREVETIHNNILRNLNEDPSLKQSDIAILVPDIARYKPVLAAVFQRGDRLLGYNLTDSNAACDSVFADAVTKMLALADGEFSRRSVFELIYNPCFMAGRGLKRSDVDIWARWADKLSIFHSFNADDKTAQGFADNDQFTWEQGLRRLRLGRVMEAEQVRDQSGIPQVRHFSGMVPYSDFDSGNPDLVGNFCLTIEGLFVRLRKLAETRLTMRRWMEEVRLLIDTFLGVPEDRPEEARAKQLFLDEFNHLLIFDEVPKPEGRDGRVSFDLIREMAATCLENIPSRHGSYLSGGITISELRANRPCPFAIVYMAGLGEGLFPGAPEFSTLDLRRPGRKIGDISVPEEHRYSVLENLMSVRKKLYMSYVSRDLKRDQIFYPGSIIVQLKSFLEHSVVDGEFNVAEVPTNSSDERYLMADPNAEWSDLMVNFSDHDRLLCLQRLLATAPEMIDEGRRESVQAWVKEQIHRRTIELPASDSAEAARPEPRILQLRHLLAFLEDPMEAALKYHLGLFEERDTASDLALIDEEPFFSDRQIRRELCDAVIRASVRAYATGNASVAEESFHEAIMDGMYADYLRCSKTPEGVFSRLDRESVKAEIRERLMGKGGKSGILASIDEYAAGEFTEQLVIGEADRPAETGANFAPLQLDIPDVGTVELHGSQPMVWHDAETGVSTVLHVTHDRAYHQNFPLPKQVLRPALFYLAALAGDESCAHLHGGSFRVLWANGNGVKEYAYRIQPERAREYLADLCAAYYSEAAYDLLPYQVISSLSRGKTDLPIPLRPGSYADDRDKANYARRLEHEISEQLGNPWSQWYQPKILRLLPVHVPLDCWDKIRDRLAIFHETL